MKTASVKINADGTMTLLCSGEADKEFDTLSRLVTYCENNGIVARFS